MLAYSKQVTSIGHGTETLTLLGSAMHCCTLFSLQKSYRRERVVLLKRFPLQKLPDLHGSRKAALSGNTPLDTERKHLSTRYRTISSPLASLGGREWKLELSFCVCKQVTAS